MRIYIASKTVHAPRWLQLRAEGVPIISTWIDEAGVGETKDMVDLWVRCEREARECDVLVLYREKGEVLKGAYLETGIAIAMDRRIIAVGDFEGQSFLFHPLIEHKPMEFHSVEKILRGLKP